MSRVNVLTIAYHPFHIVEASLRRFREYATGGFAHYMIDNRFPLEPDISPRLRHLCDEYGIHYIDPGRNLGFLNNYIWFEKEFGFNTSDDVIINYEGDCWPLTRGFDEALAEIHRVQGDFSMVFLNNPRLDDNQYREDVVNGQRAWRVADIVNPDLTWLQIFSYNPVLTKLLNPNVSDSSWSYIEDPIKRHHDYARGKEAGFLVLIDHAEDMEHFREANYVEYKFYRECQYHYSRLPEFNYEPRSFESFLENIEDIFTSRPRLAREFIRRYREGIMRGSERSATEFIDSLTFKLRVRPRLDSLTYEEDPPKSEDETRKHLLSHQWLVSGVGEASDA